MNLKNKGFVFIETIVTVLVLSTSLLYLYNSYNNIIDKEETRVYYDDVAYIYKTNYIKKFLEESLKIDEEINGADKYKIIAREFIGNKSYNNLELGITKENYMGEINKMRNLAISYDYDKIFEE